MKIFHKNCLQKCLLLAQKSFISDERLLSRSVAFLDYLLDHFTYHTTSRASRKGHSQGEGVCHNTPPLQSSWQPCDSDSPLPSRFCLVASRTSRKVWRDSRMGKWAGWSWSYALRIPKHEQSGLRAWCCTQVSEAHRKHVYITRRERRKNTGNMMYWSRSTGNVGAIKVWQGVVYSRRSYVVVS